MPPLHRRGPVLTRAPVVSWGPLSTAQKGRAVQAALAAEWGTGSACESGVQRMPSKPFPHPFERAFLAERVRAFRLDCASSCLELRCRRSLLGVQQASLRVCVFSAHSLPQGYPLRPCGMPSWHSKCLTAFLGRAGCLGNGVRPCPKPCMGFSRLLPNFLDLQIYRFDT